MAVSTLEVSGSESVAADAAPTAKVEDGEGGARARTGMPRTEFVLPIFDDDGVMITVVLAEDDDLD